MLRSRVLRLLALALVIGLAAGCGGDDGDGDAQDEGGTTTAPSADGGDDPVVLSAQEVCDAIPATAVGEALGLEVTGAEAADMGATPQCAYTFESATGGTSNLTIAAMDSTAVAGRTGEEAFDFVAAINRESAGGTDVEERVVEAGERAILFTGAVHLGIVAADGHLITVIVPLDADTDAVEQLLVAVADSVSA